MYQHIGTIDHDPYLRKTTEVLREHRAWICNRNYSLATLLLSKHKKQVLVSRAFQGSSYLNGQNIEIVGLNMGNEYANN